MTTATPAPPTTRDLLAQVAAALPFIAKSSTNQAQGFRYRSVDDVVNAVGPELRKVGLVCVPVDIQSDYDQITVGRNNTPMRHVAVKATYRIMGPADYLQVVSIGEAMDSADKATSKALAVAYRTLWVQTLCLPTDSPVTAGDEAAQDTAEWSPAPNDVVEDLRERIAALSAERTEQLKAWCQINRITVKHGQVTAAQAEQISAELDHLELEQAAIG